jgi:integrase/recombinase XerD
MPKKSRRLPEFLRPAESDALLAAAAQQRAAERDRLILLCGLGAGLRVSEIVSLRIEDVDAAGRIVFVRLGKGKRDRYVPIPDVLANALAKWIGDRPSGWLFPSPRKADAPLTPRAVGYLVAKLAKVARLVKDVHPHTLRHSYATQLLRAGADVKELQQLLGHADLATTAVYLHVVVDRLHGVVNKLAIGGAGSVPETLG